MKQNNQGRFQVEKNNKKQAQWSGFGDIEGLTLADYKESNILYLVQERQGLILEVDLSDYGSFKIQNSWNIASTMGGGDGAEAITFVPDKFLLEQNFVDSKGNLYLSKGGMGGLTLVGNQRGGYIYAYDLNRKDSTFVFVGRYMTEREDVSGLEFDRSSGLLYIWHGAQFNQLSVARLSSSLLKNEPKLETQKIYNGPGAILNEDNHEGIAITSTNECLNGKRRFFLITDHGLLWSLKMFNQFPCNKEEVLLNRSSVIL
ncbi:MAG: hypothetical protein KZQ74_11015 [gamma proteobacterium symbiont of Bathyaustriella thionipta]|nr:hypothetical protein [gamma proteobacterium symbiont of Bathyaustriella thionipta]MCU7956437.1 hypothetical protein [gamma proteobacterium symbiont of Bathyaustriella thionipta]MCU7967705.1 hypothetical protein [gamma proteobacterium symbiont of Bathyaustriella thionipta]